MPLRSLDDFKVGFCVNCGEPTPKGKLYCGQRCSQIVELVRYARRKLAEGTYDRPDIAEAITIRRGLVIGGGYYDREGRKVPPEARDELRKRSSGKCEKCGCTFTDVGDRRFTIQHAVTEQGVRLSAWCFRCNMDDVLAKAVPIANTGQWLFALELDERVRAPKPLYIVDDPNCWPRVFTSLFSGTRRSEAKRSAKLNEAQPKRSPRPTKAAPAASPKPADAMPSGPRLNEAKPKRSLQPWQKRQAERRALRRRA